MSGIIQDGTEATDDFGILETDKTSPEGGHKIELSSH